MTRCKVYLSDEGFGHIVRQRAIIEALRSIDSSLDITLQTSTHLETALRFIPGVRHIDRFNNIVWHKLAGGSPDLAGIQQQFENYESDSRKFIENESADFNYDFVISDFVFEAFGAAAKNNVPSFGVAHFTWDWFFSKLYPPPLEKRTLQYMMHLADQAATIFFPPFTPAEILSHYKNGKEVPLILRKNIDHKISNHTGKFKVLIADSGAGVISESIRMALNNVKGLNDFLFFVADKFKCANSNVAYIPQEDLMVDYISDMDLVIGRAGYNTISECIGLRTPMLLLGEAMNPEINENIIILKHHHLASFISMNTFTSHLHTFLPRFLDHEYKFILENINAHEIPVNGAEVIAHEMLKHIHDAKQ